MNFKVFKILFIYFAYVHLYVRADMCVCCNLDMKADVQPVEVHFLFPLCGFQQFT